VGEQRVKLGAQYHSNKLGSLPFVCAVRDHGISSVDGGAKELDYVANAGAHWYDDNVLGHGVFNAVPLHAEVRVPADHRRVFELRAYDVAMDV